MNDCSDLQTLVARLQQGEVVPRPVDETWRHVIDRISVSEQIAEIDQETYWYFLEVLPPKYQRGHLFAFAEGAEPLRLFWQRGGRSFCRQLTWDETTDFCRLARIPLPW